MYTRVFKIKKLFWYKNIIIRYEEGTIADYLEFKEISGAKWLEKWLYIFLNKLTKINSNDFFLILVNSNLKDIATDIIQTRFKGLFDKEWLTNTKEDENQKEVKDYEQEELFFKFKTYIAYIGQLDHLNFDDFTKKYTFTKFFEIADLHIYNENQKFTEWQEMNQKKLKLMKIAEMKKYNIL